MPLKIDFAVAAGDHRPG